MKSAFFIILLCSLLLFACQKSEDIGSQQSIQELVSGEPVKNTTQEIKEQPQTTQNETAENETVQPAGQATLQETTITDETPVMNKKCRYSTILYGGCKWNDAGETTFDLKIQNAGKYTVTATWIIITGESGGKIIMKRPEDILSGAIRTYNLNYIDLVKEVGTVKRMEIYPVESINSTEYACENMRVYTIPEAYCKPSQPKVLNEDGTFNETG